MNTHKDERGIIEDLKVGKDWSVTYISFKKGAVRGNHWHGNTIQVDTVLSGGLILKTETDTSYPVVREILPGDTVTHLPRVKHSYIAIRDSEIVSTCRGVRIGENYEEDTFRLETPLL